MQFQIPDPKSLKPKPVVVPTKQVMAGFTASSARSGDYAWVEECGFHTFDEGLSFYSRLEAFNEFVLHCGLTASSVDRMLVCISKTETHIYVNNELPMIAMIRSKRSMNAGEGITRDDVAGVSKLEFPNVQPPAGSGFLLLVSADWRRGICFDFTALNCKTQDDSADAFDRIKHMGGMVLAHLWFAEKFLLSEEDWQRVLDAGWFPFISLPDKSWQSLITSIRNAWDLSADEQKIHETWLETCDTRLQSWKNNKHFANHIPFLESAVQHYKEQDWLAVVSIALPRVEGLMRMAFGIWGTEKEVIEGLAQKVSEQEHCRSLLFPDRLTQYFAKVFFRFIPFNQSDPPNTRQTLAHGVVPASKLTRKEALTLLLLIDHILYCMPIDPDQIPPSPISQH